MKYKLFVQEKMVCLSVNSLLPIPIQFMPRSLVNIYMIMKVFMKKMAEKKKSNNILSEIHIYKPVSL